MNWKHIEAVMKGGYGFKRADFYGRVLISNSHIALFYQPGEFELPAGDHYEPLAKLWADSVSRIGVVVEPGGLFTNGKNFARRMGGGKEFIDEAYFRCFDKCTWHLGPAHSYGYSCLIACEEGVAVAVLMPTRASTITGAIMEDVSDEDVFYPFCSQENGYYLINRQKLSEHIEEARESMDKAEEMISELEAEVDEWKSEISAMELRLKTMDAKRSQRSAARSGGALNAM